MYPLAKLMRSVGVILGVHTQNALNMHTVAALKTCYGGGHRNSFLVLFINLLEPLIGFA